VVALRDSVEGWQSAGRPLGRPIDIDSDRRLADAVTHLTAAAAALDALTTIDNPAAGGTYLSVDTSGRSRVQAGSTSADCDRLVRDARRIGRDRPSPRSGDARYSVLARVGDAALAYRSHCWEHDPRA
jgi:hypothetical protein